MITFTTESGGSYEYKPAEKQWRRTEGPRNVFMDREDGVWHDGHIPPLVVGQPAYILDTQTNTRMRVTTAVTSKETLTGL